jgi:glycosyltransferase involved in cell wall biosynthesis
MRVAHIITRLILGGAQENTVLNCEDLLRDYGDDVLLLTGPPHGQEGSLLQRARAARIPMVIVPSLQRAIHPWRDWVSLRRLNKELRAFKPDVVHTHSGKAGLLGRMAARARRVPAIVHTVHGAPFHAYQSPLARSLFCRCERYAARRCDRIVSVADAMTELMVGAGIAPREKFVTVYSGMEVDQFLRADELRYAVRRELGYNDGQVVVGKVARLFHLKGHEFLIEAAAQLVQRHPQLQFLFVGDGILADQLQQQVNRAALGGHVRMLGLVGPERIPGLMAAMDILAHTSLREGLARVLPQALITGRPVVSFDIDGAREVVIPGETGFLVPPKDVAGIVAALEALTCDAGLRQRLGAEGRRRFADQFRHETMTRRLREIYLEILAQKGLACGTP